MSSVLIPPKPVDRELVDWNPEEEMPLEEMPLEEFKERLEPFTVNEEL